MFELEIITDSEKETFELGKNFAKELKFGDTVAFFGDLGAGKTEFIKGICSHFHVHDLVSSPTFTIMNSYTGKLNGAEFPIYHIDLYRIKEKEELFDIGFSECIFSNDSIKLIEWSENSRDLLPDNKFTVTINNFPDVLNKRKITLNKFVLETTE